MSFILYPPKSSVLCHIFNYPIKYYGVIMTFAIIVGLMVSYNLFLKKNSKNESYAFFDNITPVIILSIIGARVFYVLGAWEFYFHNTLEIIMINHGGLSIWGAIFFGICTLFFLFKNDKNKLLKYFDAISATMPLCQAIGRFGNYFNQEAYGAPFDGFLKLYVSQSCRPNGLSSVEYYHPAFLYESVLDLILFFILLYFYKKNLKNGAVFYLYLIFYALIRLIVESIRIDSVLNIGQLKIAQIISIFVLLIALFLIYRLYKKSNN